MKTVTGRAKKSCHLKVPIRITDNSQKQTKNQVAKKHILKVQLH